jgi:hypothetical protein
MSPFKHSFALAAVFAAGCAAAPERPADRFEAAAEAAITQTSPAVPIGAPTVVELRVTDPDPEETEVICRQILKPSSNVIVTQCLTRDAWKNFERAQELQAQELLRRIRGSY